MPRLIGTGDAELDAIRAAQTAPTTSTLTSPVTSAGGTFLGGLSKIVGAVKTATNTAAAAPTITAPPSPAQATVSNVPRVKQAEVDQPTAIDQPEVKEADDTPAAQPSIGDATAFNPAVLAQILTALEAQYGLSQEQLLADQSEVGRLYRFINQNLGRMETTALEGGVESSLGRGILRSGIHLEQQAETERDFAERQASAEGEQAQQLTYINNQLAQLEAQKQAEIMAAAQGFGQQGLNYAQQYAGSGAFAPQPAATFGAGAQAQGAVPQTVGGLVDPAGFVPPQPIDPALLQLLARQGAI